MKYNILLCDADDTIFDFAVAEREALHETLQISGLPTDDDTKALYHRINNALWQALERGEVTQGFIKDERFRQLLEALLIKGDGKALSATYVQQLGRRGDTMPNAVNFAKSISSMMPIYLVTNGISVIQRNRLDASPLKPYIADIIISEEVGSKKPDPAMLLLALEKAGISKEKAVMLGDSITADIPAANAAQVDSILITWGKAVAAHGATYTAKDLNHAHEIITGRPISL